MRELGGGRPEAPPVGPAVAAAAAVGKLAPMKKGAAQRAAIDERKRRNRQDKLVLYAHRCKAQRALKTFFTPQAPRVVDGEAAPRVAVAEGCAGGA